MGISQRMNLRRWRRMGACQMVAITLAALLAGCGSVAEEAQRLPQGELPPAETPEPRPAPSKTPALQDGPVSQQPAVPLQKQAARDPLADAPAGTKAPQTLPPSDALVHELPIGDLPGWKQVFREDFKSGDVAIGGFPGPAYDAKWSEGYKDGTPDSAGQAGEKSGYYPSKVLSVKNGMLDWYLHTENGVSMGAAPTPKIPNNSSNPHRANSLLYGRISVRFKADPLKGFKTAWLLWPDSGIWPRDGEVDFPESDLAASSFYGAVHKMGNDPRDTDVFYANAAFTSWHVATMEWSPGKVQFFLDGRSLGAGTSGTPTTPMHYILQTESCMFHICPKPEAAGHLYLDWIAIWKRA